MTNFSRRDFIAAASAAAAGVIGERRCEAAGSPQASANGVIDGGPIRGYPDDDVYDKYRDRGLFIIRRDKQIFALSSICTHKGCKVRVADDLSFFCKCHHSTFDKDGHVTKGPAKLNLPRLAIQLDPNGHILIDVDQQLP